MKRVFLGGTCNGSRWRSEIIPMLKIEYFDPVVEDWTPEAQDEEIRQREICDYCLYVITPKMAGVYSIAEVIDDSNKRPNKTIFCFLAEDDGLEFTSDQTKSLRQVGKMVDKNGGIWCNSLQIAATYMNS